MIEIEFQFPTPDLIVIDTGTKQIIPINSLECTDEGMVIINRKFRIDGNHYKLYQELKIKERK